MELLVNRSFEAGVPLSRRVISTWIFQDYSYPAGGLNGDGNRRISRREWEPLERLLEKYILRADRDVNHGQHRDFMSVRLAPPIALEVIPNEIEPIGDTRTTGETSRTSEIIYTTFGMRRTVEDRKPRDCGATRKSGMTN